MSRLLDQQKAYHQLYLDRESPANRIYYTEVLVQIGESSIWAFQGAGRISKVYKKLFE